MRYLLVVFVIFGAGLGYVRFEQPEVWNAEMKHLMASSEDDRSLDVSLANRQAPPSVSLQQAAVRQPQTDAAKPIHVEPIDQQPSSPSVPAATTQTPLKEYVAPFPLPQQPNWTWSLNGKDYQNVVVTKAEADEVHITYAGGIGCIKMSDLPPDLQKQFNYDPQLAEAAAKAKANAMAAIDAEQAPKIRALQQQQQQQQQAEEDAEAKQKALAQAREAAAVRADQARQAIATAQDDMSAASKHVSVDPKTGQVYGDNYWVSKYEQDAQQISQNQQAANSGGH